MAPPSNPRQDRAVAMVLAGTEVRAAVLASKLPEASADNVRKRVRRARARELADASLNDDAEALREAEKSSRRALYRRDAHRSPAEKKPKHPANIRYTTHQVDVVKRAELARLRATIEAYKGATTEFAALLTGPRASGCSARGIVEKFNAKLLAGAKPLQEKTVRQLVNKGMIGVTPPKPGRRHVVPHSLISATATYIMMEQAAGDEKKPRELKRLIRAAAMGTKYAPALGKPRQLSAALERVRTDHAGARRCFGAIDSFTYSVAAFAFTK
jgi:hypothetical protein